MADSGKPAFINASKTASAFAAGTAISNPPEVWASQHNIFRS
jgi:hypothetical protein